MEVTTPLEAELAARVIRLESLIREYAQHTAWRCEYRSRYGRCACGLDYELEKLGLPPIPVHDPEGASAIVESE